MINRVIFPKVLNCNRLFLNVNSSSVSSGRFSYPLVEAMNEAFQTSSHHLIPAAPSELSIWVACMPSVSATKEGPAQHLVNYRVCVLEIEYTLNSVVSHLWQPKCMWHYGIL